MPRNGSGTYSIPNTFNSGTTISSSAVNANSSDIASEITNSLPRDGQASMTGQFKASTGSAAAPGITFGADLDTGFYRKASGSIGVVSDGTEIGVFSADGLDLDAISLDNDGLRIKDTNGSHDLILQPGSDLTDDRTVTLTTGDANRTVTLSGNLTVSADSAVSGNVTVASGKTLTASNTVTLAGTDGTTITLPGTSTALLSAADVATQAEMETGTSTEKLVPPGRQKHHPCHPKAWGLIALGASPSITAHSGISGVTRPGTGRYEVTYTTAMTSEDHALIGSVQAATQFTFVIISKATTGFVIQVFDSGGSGSNSATAFNFTVMGDQ